MIKIVTKTQGKGSLVYDITGPAHELAALYGFIFLGVNESNYDAACQQALMETTDMAMDMKFGNEGWLKWFVTRSNAADRVMQFAIQRAIDADIVILQTEQGR